MRKILLFLLSFSIINLAAAQNTKDVESKSYPRNIKDDTKQPRSNATALFKKYFEVGADDDLIPLASKSDALGFTHDAYQQYYKKVKVEGAVYTIHSKNGIIETLSGEFKGIKGLTVTPVLSNTQAFQKALDHVHASLYAWDPTVSSGYPSYKKPSGELVIIGGSEGDGLKPTLAWKFDIYAVEPLYRAEVYVDAKTGEIIFENNRIHTTSVIGSANTKYNGIQSITTDNTGTNAYRLREINASNVGIETYSLNNGTNYTTATDVQSSSNYFTADPVANQAHWGAERTYDFYKSKFGRNSYNGTGGIIQSYVHYSNNYVNAFWDGTRMTYGDGDAVKYGPLVSLDICGHEITHGVTQYAANLTYSNESGALNESFSDIFGEAIENFAKGGRVGDNDWLMGCDIGITPACGAFRSMSNPNAYSQPDTYKGLYYYTGTSDNGGVHTNSGVQNKWFYILVNGESGTNDAGNSYNVAGIGLEKAAQIAYRNLTVYLSASSGFAAARTGAIQAASDLYGAGSAEVIATTNAWYAVGIGCQYGTVCYCASQGNSQVDEWIAAVSVGTFSNISTASPYTYYSQKNISLNAGSVYNVKLTPGFKSSAFPEYWRVWIDYNKDNDFEDAGELLYDAGATSTSARTGSITIDPNATGTTRMRISMKYNAAPTSCEVFGYGEVEDYPVTFTTGAPPPIVTTVIKGYDFLSSLQSWVVSSSTNCLFYNGGTYAYQSTGAMQLQGKGTTATSPNSAINLSSFAQSKLDFFFYPLGVENPKTLVVSYSNDGGTTYSSLATFTSGSAGVANNNFTNQAFYKASITFNNSKFGTNVRFRFTANGADATDQYFIDSITVKGLTGTTAGVGVVLQQVTKGLVAAMNKSIATESNNNTLKSVVLAFPNPFTDRINIRLNAKQNGKASLILYNMSGQRVATIFEGELKAGTQTFNYTVPPTQRRGLIYIFRQNGEAETGQIFGLK